MDTAPMNRLLGSLCISSPWSYAIFWKLQQQSPMLLIFEDGYFDYQKLQQSCLSMIGDCNSGQEDVIKSIFGAKVRARQFNECPIGVKFDNLPCCQYKVGEGLVGEVALSGDELWIYSDDVGSLISTLEFPDEWLLPMKAGIKTILLSAILPHGVLQLGSLQKVAKDPAMIVDIKGRFIALQSTTFSASFASDANGSLFSSTNAKQEKDDISLSSSSLNKRVEYEYLKELCLRPDDDVTAISQYAVDEEIPFVYSDLDIHPDTLDQFVIANITETIEDFWTFSSQENGYLDSGFAGASPSGTFNYLMPEEMQVVPEDENVVKTGCINSGDIGVFPRDYELQEVLGADMQTENDRHSCSSDEENAYLVGGLDPLAARPTVWFGEGDDQEDLLEAVVNSLCNNSNENISYWCNSSRSSITSFAEIAPSFQVQNSYEEMAATTQDTTNLFGECTIISGHQSSFGPPMTSPSSFESLASGCTEEKPSMESPYDVPSQSTEVPGVRGKCRPKSGHRPRPRDRQLIQERLKELRELVPNGEKSSIDGLLDQTIKHMMFLKNVTEQAEKVKRFSDPELTANEKPATRNGHTFGSSWAMDVGDNLGSCPIIVKDLERPGDILIKMLCNNEEVFFEMAQVMHQLKLTILRGVMETHSEKWAHFVVQASNGFNRLDIFWPLMRILQRNGNWNLNQWCPNI